MLIFKVAYQILLKIRDIFQNLFKKVFDKVRDENGKIFRGIISPDKVKPFLIAIAGIFLAIALTSRWWGGVKIGNDQMDKFRKEMSPKLENNDVPPSIVFSDDPIVQAMKEQEDATHRESGTNAGIPPIDARNYLGVVANPKGLIPTKDQCNALMDKMKTGEDLVGDDKTKMNTCIDKNVAGWTPDQLQMAKALIENPDLTPEERKLLVKGLNNQLTPEELALARALSGKDEAAKALARAAIQSNDEEAKKALADSLMGKKLNDVDSGILAELAKKLGISDDQLSKLGDSYASAYKSADALAGLNGTSGTGSGLNGTAGLGGDNGMTPEAMAALAKELQERDARLKTLEEQVAAAQAAATPGFKELEAGRALSEKDQAAVDKYNALQKQLMDLRKEQQARQALLLKNASIVQGALAQAAQAMNETVESGFSVAYEDAPVLDMKKIGKPIGPKVVRVKTTDASKVLVDLNGNPLSPDKVQLITIRRKNLYDIKRKKDSVRNPNQDFLAGSQPIDAIGLQAKNGQQPLLDVSTLFFFNDKSLKNFNLTGDMRIPAVLQTLILVSDKGHPQLVRAQTLMDVHNPEDNTIVIPKGSIIMGSTSQFDADTGLMDLTLNKVYIGSGKSITQAFTVTSANGNPGLAGEVHDTRGKYLLGAFITSFTAGALNWFSQDALAPYTTATDVGNAMIGAAGAGGADVMNKLSEMYAGDLQNAAKLFYVPKGVDIILSPIEQ
jgi:hypothetical protein